MYCRDPPAPTQDGACNATIVTHSSAPLALGFPGSSIHLMQIWPGIQRVICNSMQAGFACHSPPNAKHIKQMPSSTSHLPQLCISGPGCGKAQSYSDCSRDILCQAILTHLWLCTAEGVSLAAGTMDTLGKVSGGDLRKAITCLQSAVRLGGSEVQPATILDVAGAVPASVTTSLMAACRGGTFSSIQV